MKLTRENALQVTQQGWPQKDFVFQKEDNKAFYFETGEEEVRVFKDNENDGYFSVEGRLVGDNEWDDWDIFSKEEVQAYIEKANEAKFKVAQNQHRYINTLPPNVQVLVKNQVQRHLFQIGYKPIEVAPHVESAMASRLGDVEEVIDYEELQKEIDKQAGEQQPSLKETETMIDTLLSDVYDNPARVRLFLETLKHSEGALQALNDYNITLPLPQKEVDKMLQRHEQWLASDGKEGQQANFREKNLAGIDLSNRTLENIDFTGANLRLSNFEDSNIKNSNFADADLESAAFDYTVIKDCKFDWGKLVGATFENSELERVSFTNSDLTGGSFVDTSLSDVDFSQADLAHIRYELASAKHIKGLPKNKNWEVDFS